jgi:hypothetical protein
MMAATMPRAVPGSILLAPVPLAAVVVLVLNDLVWKYRYGNFLTGKLSDVAGLYLLPLVLLSVAMLVAWGRRNEKAVLRWAALTTAVGFAAVKLVPAVATTYEHAIGAIRWLLLLGTRDYMPIIVIVDPTDLITLPAILGAFWTYRRYARGRAPAAGSG